MKIVAQNEDVAMGIDVAKSHLAITVMSNEEVLKQVTIRHARPAIESFLRRFPDCRIRAAAGTQASHRRHGPPPCRQDLLATAADSVW